MKFNLLDYGYITTSGTVSFSLEDMENILSVSGTTAISSSNDDNVWIFTNIVDRIAIDEIRYYFDSSTASGTVLNGIHFYYKNDAPDSYTELSTNIGDGYYYATVSSPRYIKLNHTVSGTGIDGTIVGFEILNDDSVVEFGSDGALETSTTLTSLTYLNYNDYIKEIEIYNGGDSIATAHVFLDPQDSDVDYLLSISASEDGPWVQARNIDYVISNTNNWVSGRYVGTSTSEVGDGKLRIDSTQVSGTYTTPIFKNDSVRFAYIDMLSTSVSGAIVAVDSDDYKSTLEIRSSHTKPLDYNTYRVLAPIRLGVSPPRYYYRDYSITTGEIIFDSYVENGDYFYVSHVGTYGYMQYPYCCHIDNNSGKCVIFNSWAYYGSGSVELFLLSKDGFLTANKILKTAPPASNFKFYFIDMDENNFWFYFYTASTLTNIATSAGYYLLNFDLNLDTLYNEGSSTNFISACDIIKDGTGSIWISRSEGTQGVYKLSSTGTILITYDNVTNVTALCTAPDGGCYFVDEGVLYKINASGNLESSVILEIYDEVTFITRDESDNDFLWIVDGLYIKLISTDGRVYKSIYFEGYIINRIFSTKEYLVVNCSKTSDGYWYIRLIGRQSGGVEKELNATYVYYSDIYGPKEYGISGISYDSQILGDIIPLADDPVWNNNLPWNKVPTENAILPREEYNQLRLTLRRPNTSIDSPTVDAVYYQDNVEIANISPGHSKTLYLKISLPDGMSFNGDYSSMLRVWWEKVI